MASPHIDYDDNLGAHTDLSFSIYRGSSNIDFRTLFRESQEFIGRYLALLPLVDSSIAKLYYIDGLSQEQISRLMNITQAAVSRRLKLIIRRIRYLLKMPNLNPLDVRFDFERILPEHLVHVAFFFYFESSQNRVKFFLETSQSGAANKLSQLLKYLDFISSQTAWVDGQRLSEGQPNSVEQMDPFLQQQMTIHGLTPEYLRLLARTYSEFFYYSSEKANIITHLYKKNDHPRTNSIIQGPDITTDAAEEFLNTIAVVVDTSKFNNLADADI